MPEPLQIPAMRTGMPSISAVATAPLGKVSVVMIARAAGAQLSGESLASISGRRTVILASSSSTPITPVDASITSRWRQSSRLAAAAATRRAASAPGRPVKELAQPALTTSPLTSPPPASRWRLHQSTGALPTPCRVNTPAQVVPSEKRISSTSSRTCL